MLRYRGSQNQHPLWVKTAHHKKKVSGTMSDPPHPWGVYERLQARLARSQVVNGYAIGLEAGLNRLVAGQSLPEGDVDRTVRSESRRHRYQARLRRSYL